MFIVSSLLLNSKHALFRARSFSVRKSLKIQAVVLDFDVIAYADQSGAAKTNINTAHHYVEQLPLPPEEHLMKDSDASVGKSRLESLVSILKDTRNKFDLPSSGGEALEDQLAGIFDSTKENNHESTVGKAFHENPSLLETTLQKPSLPPRLDQNYGSDAAAKYRAKIRAKTGGRLLPTSVAATGKGPGQAGDGASLRAAREIVGRQENTASQWMLRPGTSTLLRWLAVRSMLTVLLPGPTTSQDLLDKLMKQVENVGDQFAYVISEEQAVSSSREDIFRSISDRIGIDSSKIMVVTKSNVNIKEARRLQFWTCKCQQSSGANDGYHSYADYCIASVNEVQHKIEDVNGISYRQ